MDNIHSKQNILEVNDDENEDINSKALMICNS